LIRAGIIVYGTVQKVSYRDYVQSIARKLNVKGYVENLRDGTVRIICEAEEQTLRSFIEQINVKKDLIDVENIKIVGEEPATGEYQYFDIKHGTVEEEMGERLMAALNIAIAIRQDIKNMHQDLKESIQSMHQDMNRQFKDMADRYDIISKELIGTRRELLKTRRELKRSVDNLEKVVRKFLEKP